MNLIKLNDRSEKDPLPARKTTIYRWSCENKYPRLILKIAGQLFFDMDEWKQMAIKARQLQEDRHEEMYNVK